MKALDHALALEVSHTQSHFLAVENGEPPNGNGDGLDSDSEDSQFACTMAGPNDVVGHWNPVHTRQLPPVSGHTLTPYGNFLVVFGGVTDERTPRSLYSHDIWFYNISSGSCLKAHCTGKKPKGVFGHTTTLVPGHLMPGGQGDALVVHGGKQGSLHVARSLWVLQPILHHCAWLEITPTPDDKLCDSRWGHSAVLLESLPQTAPWHQVRRQGTAGILVFGGDTGMELQNDLLLLLTNTLCWAALQTAAGPSPPARRKHSAVLHQDRMFVFGGRAESCCLQDLWELNLIALQWRPIAAHGTVPRPRTGHIAVLHRDSMIVFGGFDFDINGKHVLYADTHAFNCCTQAWSEVETEESAEVAAEHLHEMQTKQWGEFCDAADSQLNALMTLSPCQRQCRRPHPRTMCAAAVHDDRLFVFGGRDRKLCFSCPFYLPLSAPPESLQQFVLQFLKDNGLAWGEGDGVPQHLEGQLQRTARNR
eukprot:GGOE01020458.1.p1 GENE.GGOE01020458.1~~GGOE01020458.1.p1  ORF type:complete len:536 (-),score=92.12 GGOE01020458.1:215-1645(-)